MMQKELKLRIADIVISVIYKDKKQKFGVDGAYRYFITDGKPDTSLHAHYGYIHKSRLGEKVFDTGTTWNMFQSEGKYILEDFNRITILESDFKSGRIYIKRNRRKTILPLSYPLDEVLTINLLAKGRGIMVHACGVSDHSQGLLFAGTSQMGKSTMANLWKSKKNARVLSDDRIIIRKMNGKFWIYGTPWHGDAKICSPERALLEKIFFLKHAKKNTVKKIAQTEATSRLIVCSFPTFWDKKGMEFTLGFCAELAEKIPCYELGFVPDESILDFIKNKV